MRLRMTSLTTTLVTCLALGCTEGESGSPAGTPNPTVGTSGTQASISEPTGTAGPTAAPGNTGANTGPSGGTGASGPSGPAPVTSTVSPTQSTPGPSGSTTSTAVPPPSVPPEASSAPSASASSDLSAAAGTLDAASSGLESETSGIAARPARVLLYHFSTLDIPTVPQQLQILTNKLESWGDEVDVSEDPSVFSDQNLTRYAAVGMINTCFSPFGANKDGAAEGQVLQRFLQEAGGLFGIHCADVTFQSANPPALYNQLLGGRASSSNFEGTSQCRTVADHPTTAALPATFTYDGNLDGTNFLAEDTQVLVHCAWDEGNGQDVAVSWVRNEGPGRVFFSNFAKVDKDLTDPVIGDPHLVAGLSWVLGR